jgi:hypothetical protein
VPPFMGREYARGVEHALPWAGCATSGPPIRGRGPMPVQKPRVTVVIRGPVDGQMLARASHLGGMRPRTPAGGAITEDLCEVEEDACLREL